MNHLLKRLSVRDVVALSQVNRSLSKVCRNMGLWRTFCEKDFKMKFSDKNQTKKRFKNIYAEEYLKSKGKGGKGEVKA